jgi:leucyl-tRNA---protein transferase
MISLFTFNAPAAACHYLPEEISSNHYDYMLQATAEDYQERMVAGWRRFGRAFFVPGCPRCRKCLSLRIPVAEFVPSRSQRRAWKANEGIDLFVGEPEVTREKLDLYDRYHQFQVDAKGWEAHEPKDAREYAESFTENPFPTEEWRYTRDGDLIGIGYVDVLPQSLSAIYFFYEPDEKGRSLGTYNVLRLIAEAKRRGIPHIYLGYYVAGCESLEYKSNFRPNEVYDWQTQNWTPYRTHDVL